MRHRRRLTGWATALLWVAVAVPIAGPVFAQVGTGTVTSTTAKATPPPPPPRPRRKPRRARRPPRPRRAEINPPTDKDRRVRLRKERPYAARLRPAPAPKATSTKPRRFGELWNRALWGVLTVLVIALVGLRFVAWLIRWLAQREVQAARLAQRSWPLIEGLTWIAVGVWILNRLSSGPGLGAAAVAAAALLLVIILAFNAIRDVVAGLLLNLERPFEVGDYVRVADAEGQVHAFRTRVVELLAPDGHRLLVPYRALAGITDIRPGGRKRAHAVALTLSIPDGIEPTEALTIAEEIARASPWATLASDPRITLVQSPALGVSVEAFAFDGEAQALLHADLMRSWTAACRRLSQRGA